MSKDKLFGAIIFLVGLALIVVYIIWAPLNLYISHHPEASNDLLQTLYAIPGFNWQWGVVIPLTIVVIAVGILAAWIGFSMFTTPPPVPLEELEEELEKEEASSASKEE